MISYEQSKKILKKAKIKIKDETINMNFEKRDPFFNINTKEDLKIAEKILDD